MPTLYDIDGVRHITSKFEEVKEEISITKSITFARVYMDLPEYMSFLPSSYDEPEHTGEEMTDIYGDVVRV